MAGELAITMLEIFKIPAILPALSLAKTLMVVAVPAGVVAISIFTTGLLLFIAGSNTVISNGTNGHPVV